MAIFELTIAASGVDPAAEDLEDRFFEAGCSDATIAVTDGVITLQFAREANNLEEAIASAHAAIIRAGAKVEEVKVGPADKSRKPIDIEMLRRVAADMPLQTESAGDFVRRMRDDERY
jgi:hypothetical protein